MKINQYCSVCKKHLDMDLVPTDDGGDDGVIWLRCPECRGFLPKFSSEKLGATAASGSTSEADDEDAAELAAPDDDDAVALEDVVEEDDEADAPAADAPTTGDASVAEYAAALAAADVAEARPYRPNERYEVGEVIVHLAWDDCGLVVDKASLPGNRRAIKVYFPSVGVVHLIEQSAGGF